MAVSLTLLSALVFLLGHGHAFKMRWCTTSDAEQDKCKDFKVVVEKIDNTTTFECVQAENAVKCMQNISDGKADLITLDGGDVYKAGKEFKMVPVVGEDYGYNGTLSYYAVAVVKKSNKDIQFNKLEGKKTCHTGAGKTAGWNVPVGTLLEKGYIKYDSTCNPYVAAGKYFKESCVPRVKLPEYDAKGKNPDNLCALCKDECQKDGNYAGYSGAFRCMDDDVGQVAFVKHTTVKENKPGMESRYQYLCKDGTRKEIGQHFTCNLALVPSHAVMTSEGNTNKANYVHVLLAASAQYSNDSGSFALFDSSKYGAKKDLLFKDSTAELRDVSDKSYLEFLGDDYMEVMKGLNECPTVDGAFQMRWCTTSIEEQSKCNDFKDALKNIDIATTPGCVKAGSAVECMKKISGGDADLITLDGGDVYKAGNEFRMVPVVGEDYGYNGTLSYYAVAVVKKSNKDIQFNKLEGKKTCHTGAGKTAGWNVPVGTLLEKGYIKYDSTCNPYVAAGKYFKESCVPRVKLQAYDTKGNNPDSLCALCKDECKKDGNYSGYSGAFKCMDDDVGQVAFVKHTTVKENKPGEESNYQYLCKDGTRKEIGQHLKCSLALVPSHAVMTSEGNANKGNYVRVLLEASKQYSNDSGSFALFDSSKYGEGKKDLLFKDSTVELKDVSDKDYLKFLGDDYVEVLKGLNTCIAVDGGKSLKPYFLASVVLVFVALVLSGTAE